MIQEFENEQNEIKNAAKVAKKKTLKFFLILIVLSFLIINGNNIIKALENGNFNTLQNANDFIKRHVTIDQYDPRLLDDGDGMVTISNHSKYYLNNIDLSIIQSEQEIGEVVYKVSLRPNRSLVVPIYIDNEVSGPIYLQLNCNQTYTNNLITSKPDSNIIYANDLSVRLTQQDRSKGINYITITNHLNTSITMNDDQIYKYFHSFMGGGSFYPIGTGLPITIPAHSTKTFEYQYEYRLGSIGEPGISMPSTAMFLGTIYKGE